MKFISFALSAILLGLLLDFVHQQTANLINHNLRAQELKSVQEIVPSTWRKGAVTPTPDGFEVRQGDEILGLVSTLTTATGYSAPINLLMVVDDNHILAVDISKHSETPGIGDRVERRRSTWLQQFIGTKGRDLRLRTDGGTIDHISGATITCRTVANALHQAQ